MIPRRNDDPRLKRETVYQWCIETWVDGEIEDHHHQDQLAQYETKDIAQCVSAAGGSAALEESGATGNVLVLIREVGCEANGMEDRTWAYAERIDGKLVLHATFDNGKPIPAQFCAELAATQA